VKKTILTLTLLIGLCNLAIGQDPRFSQYFTSPLTLNPANTGNFDGPVRLTSNFRNQWQGVGTTVNTGTISAEMALMKDKLKFGDRLSIGFLGLYDNALEGGFSSSFLGHMGADFCTLYLHKDRFILPSKGGNPLVEPDGGQVTKLFKGERCFFSLQDSTTMTFACKVGTLRKCESILRKHTNTKHPNDMQMFHELRNEGYALLCPIPSYSTHGETNWLAPLLTEESDLEAWRKIV